MCIRDRFGGVGERVAVVQAAEADQLAVGFDGEGDAVRVAVAAPFGRAPVEGCLLYTSRCV